MNRRDFSRLGISLGIGCLTAPTGMTMRSKPESAISKARRIPKTDTHMHLFGLNDLEYPWLKNAPEINKNFLPADFIEATRKSNVTKIVFMESGAAAGLSIKEVRWAMKQARHDLRIKGIVAKVRIEHDGTMDPPVEDLLTTGWVKGIRAGINNEMLASSDFVRCIKSLAKNNLSFDLLIRPALFSEVARSADKAPDTTFILDHLGNPDIKGGAFEVWKNGIDELAKRPNINCKISGILTRAGSDWTIDMLHPYVHYAIERFGFDRIVYGGDWPVVLRAGSYFSWSRAFEKLTSSFSDEELQKLYHLNADRMYQLGD